MTWVMVVVVLMGGALPATRMVSAPFQSHTACVVAFADLQRQIAPPPHLSRPYTPPATVAGGCYPAGR